MPFEKVFFFSLYKEKKMRGGAGERNGKGSLFIMVYHCFAHVLSVVSRDCWQSSIPQHCLYHSVKNTRCTKLTFKLIKILLDKANN